MPKPLRLFVAIELNNALITELRRLERDLQAVPATRIVRWVDPKNIHLTLKFLGNVNVERVDALTAALERAAAGLAPFELSARGLGAFPNFGRPNNLWVGLEGNVQTAALLARRIDDECARGGWEGDRQNFNPHLTLGRLNRQATNAERAAVGRALEAVPKVTYGTIHAAAVHLISSDLYPTGPVYNSVAKIRLLA